MKKNIADLLQILIRIDSQNPPGNEKEINQFIRNYLQSASTPTRIYEFQKNRTNLVCELKSKKSRKKILLTPHVDTVPATGKWKFPPLSGKIHKGRIYGRGATDCKANVAVVLSLIKEIKEQGTRLNNLDLIFAFTGDEETGSRYGIRPLMRYLRGIDYGIVLDADEFDIVVSQKGLLHLKIKIVGQEAHGAFPERGINAIEKSISILEEIRNLKIFSQSHPLLKQPTLNIGKFEGGEKVNIVAGHAIFEIDIRYLPGMDHNRIIEKVKNIIKKHKVDYKIEILAQQNPIEIDKNSFLIRSLKKVLERLDINVKLKASFGATVINFLTDKGIDAFAFGFGSRGCAHIKDEYVQIDNLYRGVEVLKQYITELDANI